MTKPILLSSAPSFVAIKDAVNRYFYDTEYDLYEIGVGVWEIRHQQKTTPLQSLRVVQMKNRFRFERVPEPVEKTVEKVSPETNESFQGVPLMESQTGQIGFLF